MATVVVLAAAVEDLVVGEAVDLAVLALGEALVGVLVLVDKEEDEADEEDGVATFTDATTPSARIGGLVLGVPPWEAPGLVVEPPPVTGGLGGALGIVLLGVAGFAPSPLAGAAFATAGALAVTVAFAGTFAVDVFAVVAVVNFDADADLEGVVGCEAVNLANSASWTAILDSFSDSCASFSSNWACNRLASAFAASNSAFRRSNSLLSILGIDIARNQSILHVHHGKEQVRVPRDPRGTEKRSRFLKRDVDGTHDEHRTSYRKKSNFSK